MNNSMIITYDQAASEEIRASMLASWLIEAEEAEATYFELTQLAEHFSALGHIDSMTDLLIELIKIKPSLEVFRLLALNYERIQEYSLAISILEQIPADIQTSQDRYQLSLLYYMIGDPNQAIEHLEDLIRTKPTFTDSYFLIAEIYQAYEDYDKALYYLQPLLDYFSDSAIIQRAREAYILIALEQEMID